MDKDTEIVARALQAGYGDATQTVLDHKVARDVLRALREAGWTSPDEVALIVEAAGGSVEVSEDAADSLLMGRRDVTLLRERLPHKFAIRLSARETARA